jgi:hypothetical protein
MNTEITKQKKHNTSKSIPMLCDFIAAAPGNRV